MNAVTFPCLNSTDPWLSWGFLLQPLRKDCFKLFTY